MLSAHDFHEIVSGRRRGVRAAVLRSGLRLAEVPYSLAVRIRNRRYDSRRAIIHRADIPVISVGNLTLGGTGKTPMVEYLARLLRGWKVRVAIVSRGYGPTDGERNDEALELDQRLPDVPHLQNPDRVAATRTAAEELESQAVILDDGFQHRRLHRDLDIVLVDALEPFGHGHVFPRGTLREPLSGLRRADVVALSRADLIDADQRHAIRERLMAFAPEARWLEVSHRPQGLLASGGTTEHLSHLSGRRITAFCGIGNPEAFRRTLERCGAQIAEFHPFPDHHAYSRDDVQAIAMQAERAQAEMILCTHKDLVKLEIDSIGDRPLWAIVIGLEVREGEKDLESHLRTLMAQHEVLAEPGKEA